MNSANIEKSSRLQRVLGVLQDGKRHSTRDIIQAASVCAVNSIIAELRDNGIDVDCQREGFVWWYWIPAENMRLVEKSAA